MAENNKNKKDFSVLLLVDGWGIGSKEEVGNLLNRVETPTLDHLVSHYPVFALTSPFTGEEISTEDFPKKYEETYSLLGNCFSEEMNTKSFSSFLSEKGMTQVHIGESYSLTGINYFFNGKRSFEHSGEEWKSFSSYSSEKILIENSQMSSKELFKEFSESLETEIADFYLISLSSLGTIPFLGNLEATLKALSSTDEILGRFVSKVLEYNGKLIVASTYGFVEHLYDVGEESLRKTPTANAVPCIVISREHEGMSSPHGDIMDKDLSLLPVSKSIEDIVPTFVSWMNLEKPEWMKGRGLDV